MNYIVTVEEFKNHFRNDFNFDVILDSDIESAFEQASDRIDCCLKNNKFAFMYLVAHLLFNRLGDGKGNEASSTTLGIVSAKKLDTSMVHYEVPEKFLKDPRYIYFQNTKYGKEYLFYLADCIDMPFVGIVGGRSQPD